MTPIKLAMKIKRLNRHHAYILGVLMGDGCVERQKNGRYYRFVLRTISKEFCNEVLKNIKKIGIKGTLYEDKNKITYLPCADKIKKYKRDYYLACVGNCAFARWLMKITNEKSKIPYQIKQGTNIIKKHFIKGMMDSEGWISIHRRKDLKRGYGYSMGIGISKTWINDFHKLFQDLNIRVGKMLYNKTTKIYYFHIRMWDYYDAKIGFSVKHKKERLEDFARTTSRIVGSHPGTPAWNRKPVSNKKLIYLYKKTDKTIYEIMKVTGCSMTTIYNRLKEEKDFKWRRKKWKK